MRRAGGGAAVGLGLGAVGSPGAVADGGLLGRSVLHSVDAATQLREFRVVLKRVDIRLLNKLHWRSLKPHTVAEEKEDNFMLNRKLIFTT